MKLSTETEALMKNSPDIGTVIGNKTSEGSGIKISCPEMTNFTEKTKKSEILAKLFGADL